MAARAMSAIVGACGEHYVAAYLSGFELIVALPRAGVPGCDLLVTSKTSGPAIRLQVKTGTEPRVTAKPLGKIYRWSTSCSVIGLNDEHLWYAYVALYGWPQKKLILKGWPETDGAPEVFFVPASFVVERMKGETEASWSYFWLTFDEAQKYKGNRGVQAISDVLKSNLSAS
jgi:hypothetical protein